MIGSALSELHKNRSILTRVKQLSKQAVTEITVKLKLQKWFYHGNGFFDVYFKIQLRVTLIFSKFTLSTTLVSVASTFKGTDVRISVKDLKWEGLTTESRRRRKIRQDLKLQPLSYEASGLPLCYDHGPKCVFYLLMPSAGQLGIHLRKIIRTVFNLWRKIDS